MLRGKMTLIQLLSLLFLLVAVYADTGTIIHMFWKKHLLYIRFTHFVRFTSLLAKNV